VKRILVAALLLTATHGAVAAPLEYESRPQRTVVLELFTSHGCSSCPPADAWLRRFVEHPDLWSRFIPMAFHVDYWNGLGWPDRFASSAYSDRQKSYRRIGAIGSVYTPGFVLSGKEWRGWFRQRSPGLSLTEEVGRLKVVAEPQKGATVSFSTSEALQRESLTAHMAILGFGLSSPIGGGENSGRTLQEDFVVLGVTSATAEERGGRQTWSLAWPESRPGEASRLALVVWLSRAGDPIPVQATGGWLP
jgi:hypothetical protein